jgi:hypothetical protein
VLFVRRCNITDLNCFVKATRARLLEEIPWWHPTDAVYDLLCRPDWVFKYDAGLYGGLYELSMKLRAPDGSVIERNLHGTIHRVP